MQENESNSSMKSYKTHLTEAMDLAAQKNNVLFVGQAVSVDGTAIRNTLVNVPQKKLIEFPVDEDFQMGFCTGLAFASILPICIFPRWNFLLLATNQIVNYLDKVKQITKLDIPPKVIIRTSTGSTTPLHPGIQHVGDYTSVFRGLLQNINVVKLDSKDQILNEYKIAIDRTDGISTLLVENVDMYND